MAIFAYALSIVAVKYVISYKIQSKSFDTFITFSSPLSIIVNNYFYSYII